MRLSVAVCLSRARTVASVARLEDGKGSTLANLVRVLTALDALDSLDLFLPMPPISPIQLAKLRGKERQRASKNVSRHRRRQ